ncbi:hypothetical protein ACH4U5_03510 [Streptomyces sp. NPDC020858]|uniref:hypothetical protein n=1 Tax=Streptomyces sp. NPDC020858 TaxID=3365097 RepID=UPI0037A629EE
MAGRQSESRTDAAWPRWAPPPALAGFVVLLVTMFALSYGVGSAAGPVAPGMHPSGTDAGPGSGTPGGGGMGGMGGTHSGGGR